MSYDWFKFLRDILFWLLSTPRKIFWIFLLLILCFDQNGEMSQRSVLTLILLGEVAQCNFETEAALTVSLLFQADGLICNLERIA